MKSTKFFIKVIFSIIGISLTLSCQKYPEGPSFSLRSAQDRIAREWEVESIEQNGQDISATFSEFSLELQSSGLAKWNYTTSGNSISKEGNWELTDNARNVVFNWGADIEEMNILRLTAKELWVEKEADTVNYFYKFKSKN